MSMTMQFRVVTRHFFSVRRSLMFSRFKHIQFQKYFQSKSRRINKHCIFVQAKTGRLLPGSAAKIRLTYVTELKVECGEVRFLLPRAMAPRFMPRIDTRGPASDLASIPQTSTA